MNSNMAPTDSIKSTHEETTKEDVKQLFDAFRQNREEIIRLVHEIAKELDEVHQNVKITKVVTGSTGIAGSILFLTGLALAIPTAGLSMFLTIGGGALAAASGTAHLGSDVAERVITKLRLEKLDELCRADEAKVTELNAVLQQENEKLQNDIGEQTVRQITTSIFSEISNLSSLTCSIVRISQAATLTVNTIKILGVASAVLNAVTLPIQIIDLAANGHALHNKQTSETSVKLRQLAELLTAQVVNIKKFIETL